MSENWRLRKTIELWLNDPKRVNGISVDNLRFMERLSKCRKELARIAAINYFLLKNFSDDKEAESNYRTMMYSAKNQRAFIGRVIIDLQKYKVCSPDYDYKNAFEKDIKSIENRCDYVLIICKENLRLSPYYPYFKAHSFNLLYEFTNESYESNDEYRQTLIRDIEEWNAQHKSVVDSWMKKVEKEKAMSNAYHEAVREKAKAEKEAQRAEEKAKREMEKEILKNKHAEEVRKRKIERSFNHLYKVQ